MKREDWYAAPERDLAAGRESELRAAFMAGWLTGHHGNEPVDAWPVYLKSLRAQGIEAQSATTVGRGPEDESPVAKPCARPLSKQSGG